MLDRFVEAAKRNKQDAEVGVRCCHVRVKPEELLILADGKRCLSALLGFGRLPEQLLRVRRLCEGGAGEEEEKGQRGSRYRHALVPRPGYEFQAREH